ncbi:DUF6577 family protein [Flagellimonas iocasae]|uniref:DUF6577 family protein n=1 Tax=Flagellimonas iocasae TaxID=2055905 RepID=A0ABW4Y4F5_9FLAO
MEIANKSLHINALKNSFDEGQKITVSDIIEFYGQFEERVKRSTIDWRLYKLTQEGILHRQSRGVYSLSEKKKKTYTPEITRSLKVLAGKIHNQFPYIETCLWTTKWLNEFMLHQPGRFYTILEVERDATESVFYALNDLGKEVFLNPSQDIISKYVSHSKSPIIIIPLITEAPIHKINKVTTCSLEKMLVDIYCDPELFSTFQGAELKRIYQAAFDRYDINKAKMLRYADRRTKKTEVELLINQQRNGS